MDGDAAAAAVVPATPQEIQQALAMNETAPNYFDPSDGDYVAEKVRNGVTVGVFGAIVLLAFISFFITRAVCCLAFGKGCCARNKKPATTKIVALNVLLVAIPIFLNFAGGIWLLLSADPVGDSLTTFTKDTIEQLDFVIEDVQRVSATAASAPDDVDLSALQEAEDTLITARADLRDREEDIDGYLQGVRDTIFVLGAASFAVGIWGFVTVAARRSPFMTAFMLMAAVVGPAMWVLGGIGLATSEVVEDFCDSMRRHLAGELNPWVLEQAKCADLLQAAEATQELQAAANAQVEEANADITEGNSQLELFAAFSPTAAQTDPLPTLCLPFTNTSGTFVANTAPADGCVPLEPSAVNASYGGFVCDTDLPDDAGIDDADFLACVNDGTPVKEQDFALILESAQDFQVINATLPDIDALSRCGFVDRAFAQLSADDCEDLQDDLDGLLTAAVLSAIGISVASFYFCVCFRNIRHRRYRPGSRDEPHAAGYNGGKEVAVETATAAEPPFRSYGDSAHHKADSFDRY